MANTKIYPIRLKPEELQWFRDIADQEKCASTAEAVRLAGKVFLAMSENERQRVYRRMRVAEYAAAEREKIARLASGV